MFILFPITYFELLFRSAVPGLIAACLQSIGMIRVYTLSGWDEYLGGPLALRVSAWLVPSGTVEKGGAAGGEGGPCTLEHLCALSCGVDASRWCSSIAQFSVV